MKKKENYYKILGVSENADDKTIKNAYRELVKKYHPDRYADSPLADIAGEKLKMINYAYDEILKQRKLASSENIKREQDRNQHNNQHYEKNSGYEKRGGISFKDVRRLISENKLAQAEIILTRLEKNAEWHYLSGLIFLRKGMYSSAEYEIKQAVRLDPNNSEYIGVLNNFSKNSDYYKSRVKQSKEHSNNANVKDCISSVCPIDFCFEF